MDNLKIFSSALIMTLVHPWFFYCVVIVEVFSRIRKTTASYQLQVGGQNFFYNVFMCAGG